MRPVSKHPLLLLLLLLLHGALPSSPPSTSSPPWNAPLQTGALPHHTHIHYVWVPMETTRKRNELAELLPSVPRQSVPRPPVPCDGMTNLVHDLTVFSLFSGVIGTVLSIFTASYTSVLSNTISALNAILSLLIGVPSAVLTYLAASDRLSYTTANVLSLLSFANTAYGALSIDFGNKDIFTSQLANVIGVFSLTLSVITAFPEALVPPTIRWVASTLGTPAGPLFRFVRKYGCYGSPTFYDVIDNFLRSKNYS